MIQWQGTGTALVTPFSGDKVDYDAATRVIQHSISGQVEFLVPLGSTGEALTIDDREQRAYLDHVIDINADRLPVVAGNFGGSDTRAQIKKIKEYNFDGISAILISSPAYNKPTQEGLFQHYSRLLELSPVPVILYNVPSRTASNVHPETIARLAERYTQLVAIKEACGDLTQIKNLIDLLPARVSVLSGDDPTAMETARLGGRGVISVISNAMPDIMSKMIRAALNGKWAEAERLDQQMAPVHPYLYTEGNPAGIKAACSLILGIPEELRLPLVPVSEDTRGALFDLLNSYHILS